MTTFQGCFDLNKSWFHPPANGPLLRWISIFKQKIGFLRLFVSETKIFFSIVHVLEGEKSSRMRVTHVHLYA